MSFGLRCDQRKAIRTFIHELIHALHKNDEDLQIKLRDLEKRYGLPIHEAFTETATNVVAWMVGLQNKPFERYYVEDWKELITWEEKFRGVLRENRYSLPSLRRFVLSIG